MATGGIHPASITGAPTESSPAAASPGAASPDTTALGTPGAKPRKRRPLGFILHSFIGLYVSLLVGFVAFTGSIATVSHELEWLAMPQVRGTSVEATVGAGAPVRGVGAKAPVRGVGAGTPMPGDNWGGMWDAARRAAPDAYPSRIAAFDGTPSPYFAREVSMIAPDGHELQVHVDAATMRVTGRSEGIAFHDAVRALHYYLFLPGAIPFYAITSLGFVLIVSLVTGLVTYKKFWRGFFKMPRWGRGVRTWAGDVHRLAGLWSLWFVTLIGVTSIWYLVERAVPPTEMLSPEAKSLAIAAPVDGATINRWVARARTEMPGLVITAIAMPEVAGDPVTIEGQWTANLVRSRTNALYIDPVSGAVLGRRVGERLGAVERWVHTADALHFGNFGGLISKLVWAVFGLILTAMAATGAVVFAKRTGRGVRDLAAARATDSRPDSQPGARAGGQAGARTGAAA